MMIEEKWTIEDRNTRKRLLSLNYESNGMVESGAAVFGDIWKRTVQYCIIDKNCEKQGNKYKPSRWLQKEIQNCSEYRFIGFAHSHPVGRGRPSRADIEYCEEFLHVNQMSKMCLVIVEGETIWIYSVLAYGDERKG